MDVVFLKNYLPWSKGDEVALVDNSITQELIQRKVIKMVPLNEPKTKQVDTAPRNKAMASP